MILRADVNKGEIVKNLSIKCWIAKDKIKTEGVYETDLYANKPELKINGKYSGQFYIGYIETYPELTKLRAMCKPGECKEIEMILRNASPQ